MDNKTLTVANIEQKIILVCEMQGQLSDGYWENTRPLDHWKTWCDLNWDDVLINSQIGTKNISQFEKRNYNFSSRRLLEIVGYRIRVKNAILKIIPDKDKYLNLLKTDEWAIPDDASALAQLLEKKDSHESDDYWSKKYHKMIETGITVDIFTEAVNRIDELYPYSQLRADCKGLKLAFNRSL